MKIELIHREKADFGPFTLLTYSFESKKYPSVKEIGVLFEGDEYLSNMLCRDDDGKMLDSSIVHNIEEEKGIWKKIEEANEKGSHLPYYDHGIEMGVDDPDNPPDVPNKYELGRDSAWRRKKRNEERGRKTSELNVDWQKYWEKIAEHYARVYGSWFPMGIVGVDKRDKLKSEILDWLKDEANGSGGRTITEYIRDSSFTIHLVACDMAEDRIPIDENDMEMNPDETSREQSNYWGVASIFKEISDEHEE